MIGKYFTKLKRQIAFTMTVVVFLQIAFLGVSVNVAQAASATIVISEVQLSQSGVGNADNEFVELYNKSANPIDLSALPLKLHIRNSAGTDANKNLTFVSSVIPANGFFLIAPNNLYGASINADATYVDSGNMLVNNGGVYVSTSVSDNVSVIDMVGFGTQPAGGFETVALANPADNESVERKSNAVNLLGNALDTDNNSTDFALKLTPEPQNTSSPIEDIIAPIIAPVTLVPTPTNNQSPVFEFNSTEAGTLTIGGSCGSATTLAVIGLNSITLTQTDGLTPLSGGVYSDCSFQVTDASLNVSNLLPTNPFKIDITKPIINPLKVYIDPNPTNIDRPSFSFNSTKAGTITYFGGCTSNVTNVVADSNTIIFNVLEDGTYPGCSFKVTDAAGNVSDEVFLGEFTVDTDPPEFTVKIEPILANAQTKKVKITVTSSEILKLQSAITVLTQQVYALGTTYGIKVVVNEGTTPVTYLVPKGEDGKYTFEHEITTKAEKTVQVQITGEDLAGNKRIQNATFKLDNIAPNSVRNLKAIVENGKVILTWDDAENTDFKGVKILRDGKELTEEIFTGNSFEDKNIAKGITYVYDVYSYDNAGNVSEKASARAVVEADKPAVGVTVAEKLKEEIKASTDEVKPERDKKDTEVKDDNKLPVWGMIFLVTLAGIGGYLFYSQSGAEAISKIRKK